MRMVRKREREKDFVRQIETDYLLFFIWKLFGVDTSRFTITAWTIPIA